MRRVKLLGAAAALIAIALLSGRARATPVTYTFSGSGGGTVNGNTFDGAFTFIFTGDTTAIDTSGAPFYRYDDIGGTFTEGSIAVTLAPTVTIVATADSSTPRINFFNANTDDGLGMNDPSLATYALSTSFGPLTVTAPGTATSFLTPTFNSFGDGFVENGGELELTSDTSLTFEAVVGSTAVPEPASLTLLGATLLGFGMIRRRRRGA